MIPDPVALASALSALKASADITKGVGEGGFEHGARRTQLKIAELATFVEARAAVLDAQEELVALSARVAELEKATSKAEEMETRDGVLWPKSTNDSPAPYCPRCWQVDHILVTVGKSFDAFFGKYICPNCKAAFGVELQSA